MNQQSMDQCREDNAKSDLCEDARKEIRRYFVGLLEGVPDLVLEFYLVHKNVGFGLSKKELLEVANDFLNDVIRYCNNMKR